MNLLLTCNWQNVIDAIPCFCWGLLILIGLIYSIKYIIVPCMNNCHECKMKEAANKREKEWANFESTKASTDEHLINSKKELEDKLKLETTKNELLEKQLQVYKEFIKQLNLEIKPRQK